MKKKKIPGLFKKKYPERKLQTKVLKRIHIPKDRALVLNLFAANDEGKMELIQDIPDEVFSRLKPLAKSIKKNRGFVSRWKAAVVLVVVGSALIFNLVFKDKLVGRAAESALESVFQGAAEIQKPRFSLLKGTFSYGALSIADADDRMRNLIETGPAELRINMGELAKKRFRIEEASLTGVRWDTIRQEGSALPAVTERGRRNP